MIKQKEITQPAKEESRWPVIIAIIGALALLTLLPARIRIMPSWFPYLTAILLIVPMLGVALTNVRVFAWVERIIIYLFIVATVVVMGFTLERLIDAIAFHRPEHPMGGNDLLGSAMAIWITNILAFALVYWQIDRGGPDHRASMSEKPADIIFPDGLTPPFSFLLYLFFAFTASTAFSPTEMFPRTPRMQLLMMLQCSMSLVTILIVASRAINMLK